MTALRWAILSLSTFAGAACGQAFTTSAGGLGGAAGDTVTGAGGSSGTTGSGGSETAGSAPGTGGSSTMPPDAGSGGTRGSGGAAGQAGHGTGGSDAGAGCPMALPIAGQSCSPEGVMCSYGKCCPTHASCSGGKWQIALTDCAVPGCPATAPTQGSSCTCVSTPLPCHYECASPDKSIDATCVNDVWSTQSSTCAAVPCGQAMCMPGQICVKRSGGAALPQFSCAPNPCSAQPLSCTCATSLCNPNGNTCSVSGSTLSCSCNACP